MEQTVHGIARPWAVLTCCMFPHNLWLGTCTVLHRMVQHFECTAHKHFLRIEWSVIIFFFLFYKFLYKNKTYFNGVTFEERSRVFVPLNFGRRRAGHMHFEPSASAIGHICVVQTFQEPRIIGGRWPTVLYLRFRHGFGQFGAAYRNASD